MQLADRENCTGCGACTEICPRGAIAFRDDEEGFPTPQIDGAKCVDCGLCARSCPALHKPEMHPIREAYAAQITDAETLKESTSGGVFTALAREIFRRGGVVYGCVWDEKYNAVIRRAENEEEIKPMRGSKYVWSWAGDTFPEIRKLLAEGRTVLFTGLPCQVAGLRKYLGKDDPRLYLMDFFCGGAPSPMAFQAYLKTITAKTSLSELNLKFRDKAIYGTGVHITYQTPAGRKYQSYYRNPYFFCYHTKVFHRPSCYHCAYRYEERVEDITMGDYWGVRAFHPELSFKAGVSAVLINTEKGAELLEAVRGQLRLVPTKPEFIARGNNLTLNGQPVTFHPPGFRGRFIAKVKKRGWNAAERRYLYNRRRLKLWMKSKHPALARRLARILYGK